MLVFVLLLSNQKSAGAAAAAAAEKETKASPTTTTATTLGSRYLTQTWIRLQLTVTHPFSAGQPLPGKSHAATDDGNYYPDEPEGDIAS